MPHWSVRAVASAQGSRWSRLCEAIDLASGLAIGRLGVAARRFCRAERANVAMTFGLALVPLIGMVGAAVDYSRANSIRTWMLAAADSAAIGSIAKSSPALRAATTMPSDGAIPQGVKDALSLFNAHIEGKNGFGDLRVSAAVEKASGTITSTVRFSASVPTMVLGIFSKGSIDVSGSSQAAITMPLYIDFYVLLDNTPSMGVGATTADIAKMVSNTSDRCAFACHDLSVGSNDYYSLAKRLGVQMRIDVLRTATQKLMDTAVATEVLPDQFRVAIYTFGAAATSRALTTIQALTPNLSSAKSAASVIDLMTVPYQNYASDTLTDFGSILTDMNSAIGNPGGGTSWSTPQKILFFVSDGVADRAVGSPACSRRVTTGKDAKTGRSYVRCQEPLDPTLCETMKRRGVKIAVLYTTYLPLPTNDWYVSWIAPFQTTIGPKMQSCASPGLYFEVSPSQGISEAMNALFKKALSEARLTR